MSKISLKSSSSGTATFTIESPSTNTDRTLVLPDVAGTVALTTDIPAAPTIASTGEAQAGTNNTNFLTPLRLREGFNAPGSAPIFAARAWVNFNGTGTVAIRASGNVSSITDNNTGDYTINMANAMPDLNYCFTPGISDDGFLGGGGNVKFITGKINFDSRVSTSALRVRTGSYTGSNNSMQALDFADINVAIFR